MKQGITFNRNAKNQIIKDKADFLRFYEDEKNNLKENVFYRSLNNKVLIKIAIPCNSKQIKQILVKIKD